MRIKVRTLLNGLIKEYKALKKNNEITYLEDTCLVKITDNKIKRENEEFSLELDLIKKECYYLLKEAKSELRFNFEITNLEQTDNSLKIKYII